MKTKGPLKDMSWPDYAGDMRARFHDTEFSDPLFELVSLKQINSVEEYYEEFEALLNLLQLSDEYALSIFVSNLKADISKSVRLFHPKNLTHALNIARQMEAILYSMPRKPYLPYKTPNTTVSPYSHTSYQAKPQPYIPPQPLPPLLSTPKPNSNPYTNYPKPFTSPITKSTSTKPEPYNSRLTRGPTREEREDRRRRGLCMFCAQKFVQGHRCIKSQLYQILIDEPEANEGEPEEFLDCVDSLEAGDQKEDKDGLKPTISLHALMGTEGCQTMRVLGKIKKQNLVMLIDSGSTNNFIDHSAAKRLKCPTRTITGVKVTVANGDTLTSQEVCELVR